MKRQTRDEKGAGSVLVGVVMTLVVLGGVVGMWIAGWLGNAERAANAADLAALAGAQAYGTGTDACAAAREAAAANGARLETCTVEGSSYSWVVRVRASVPLTPSMVGAPQRISRDATAGAV